MKSQKTINDYKSIHKKHFSISIGSLPIGSVKTVHCDNLINSLIEKGLYPKTINKIICVFKQIIKFAIRERYLRFFPIDQISFLNEPERPFDYFTRGEIDKMLLLSQDTQFHTILIIALNTGMRIGEIFGLKWDKVFLNDGYLTVSRKMTRYKLDEFTKTKIIRNIGLNKELEYELKKQRMKNLNSEFVICNELGKPLSPDHYTERVFKRFLKKHFIRQLRFHDLRHTYASHYMMGGGSIYELQKILGHTKSDMTQRYAHLSKEHMINAASKIGFGIEPESNLIEMSPKWLQKENIFRS